MRAKRKKKRIGRGKVRTRENRTFSNRAFTALPEDLKDPDRGGQPVSSPPAPDNTGDESDDSLFQKAMKDVIPLRDNKNKVIRSPVRKEKSADRLSGHSNRVREYLSSLVEDSGAWDISFSDEYMEGAISGVGPKIMKRLKRGEFSIQDYIDLHGLTKREAETVVSNFIIQSHHQGLRCVLIVHGRGLGSVDHQPAIKKELPVWFKRGILKRIVLAFVTARPWDGGAGALYVLLKKR